MRQSRSIGQFVSRLPANLITAIPAAESDWVRYGLPAVVLTVIFFFAIRYETNDVESPVQRPMVVAPKPTAPRSKAFAALPSSGENRADISNGNPVQGRPVIVPPTSSRATVPFHPPAIALPLSQSEGIRALCSATQYALARVKRSHWRAKAMEIAIQSYRGQGGPQAAEAAINSALADYGRGRWDETQCPSGGVTPALAKGAIAAVMR